MDREAWNLTYRWHMQRIKNFYSDQYSDVLDGIKELLKLLLVVLRLILSPLLVLIISFDLRKYYKQLKTYDKEGRERVRKHIERSEKN